jgi:hypothetical protein
MMSIEDYAQDVGKTVEEIYSLCDKLGIAYKDSNTMLDDTAIILLDNVVFCINQLPFHQLLFVDLLLLFC